MIFHTRYSEKGHAISCARMSRVIILCALISMYSWTMKDAERLVDILAAHTPNIVKICCVRIVGVRRATILSTRLRAMITCGPLTQE